MVVSHYIVSWIQVGGLAVSLYGLFYLSLGLFPHISISFLRPLLPAGAAGILGYIFGQIVTQLPERPGFLLSLPPYILGLISVAVGYTIGFATQIARGTPANEKSNNLVKNTLRWALTGAGAVVFIVVVTLILTSVQVATDVATRAIELWVFGIYEVALVLIFLLGLSIPITLTPLLTESRLKMIGFVFSVIGIFTGFLPAILDVANIAVR